MKRVLILAYYAPPLGMGGTQRVAKFCQYLPDYGWEPVLLTVKNIAYYARDDELSRSLSRTRVERTGSLDPQRLLSVLRGGRSTKPAAVGGGRLASLATALMLPDAKVGWLPFAVGRALRLVKSLAIDGVLVTSPPHSAQIAGWLIAGTTGLPWIADFRDRWCEGEFQHEPTPLHRVVDCTLERWLVRRASAVVAVTRGLAGLLAERSGREDVTTIYNGFDAAEFEAARRRLEARGERRSGQLKIVFVGAVTEVSWPGTLLRAVRRLGDAARRDIRLHFYGLDLTGRLRTEVVELDLTRQVFLHGYVSHRQAIEALLESDVLFLPVSNRVHRGYVPGKLFEYLGSLRPTVASVPEGETADLLRQSGASWLCPPGDVDCLCGALTELHALWQRGALPVRSAEAVKPFERKRQAGDLARLLDSLSSRL